MTRLYNFVYTRSNALNLRCLALCIRRMSHMTKSYEKMVENGNISSDLHQLKVVKLMDKLRGMTETFDFLSFQQSSSLPCNESSAKEAVLQQVPPSPPVSRLRGIYLYGSVGTGKTMLMDLLFKECQIDRKRKVHFHQFMLEVHRRIHGHKQYLLQKYGRQRHINRSEEQDSIRFVAKEIAHEANLLCFDEFQVTDICDAVIMTRLFDTLWSQGVVLVATSNRPPSDLYLNGMNRPDFLPFIDRIQKECIVRELNNGQDYRVLRHKGDSASSKGFDEMQRQLFLHPITEKNKDLFHWNYAQDVEKLKADSISIRNASIRVRTESNCLLIPISNTNRFLTVEQAELAYGIAMVDFHTLCQTDRGASDYHALANTFHTIFLRNIPRLSKEKHNESRRFITLIDELYNANIRLVCLAESSPSELFLDLNENEDDDDNTVMDKPVVATKADTGTEHKKYGRNYAPEQISVPVSSSTSAQNSAQAYGSQGQQEELSLVESELASIQELNFAFRRATSRLLEMNSAHYFSLWQHRYMK